MDEFKFELGQIVYHKLGKGSRILIVEKNAQSCYGGRQNWYLCVLGTERGGLANIAFEPEKRFRFYEIELSAEQIKEGL